MMSCPSCLENTQNDAIFVLLLSTHTQILRASCFLEQRIRKGSSQSEEKKRSSILPTSTTMYDVEKNHENGTDLSAVENESTYATCDDEKCCCELPHAESVSHGEREWACMLVCELFLVPFEEEKKKNRNVRIYTYVGTFCFVSMKQERRNIVVFFCLHVEATMKKKNTGHVEVISSDSVVVVVRECAYCRRLLRKETL